MEQQTPMKPPFAKLLCPTDLSDTGDAAVPVAYTLVADKGTVHLLHVNVPSFVLSPLDGMPVVSVPVTAEGLEALEKRARQRLQRLAPETAVARGVKTEHHVIHDVDPASTIDREARRLGVDAIVIGTHGRTGLGRVLMGSVATDVLKRATMPVVLCRGRRT